MSVRVTLSAVLRLWKIINNEWSYIFKEHVHLTKNKTAWTAIYIIYLKINWINYFVVFLLETSGRPNQTLWWSNFGLRDPFWASVLYKMSSRISQGCCTCSAWAGYPSVWATCSLHSRLIVSFWTIKTAIEKGHVTTSRACEKELPMSREEQKKKRGRKWCLGQLGIASGLTGNSGHLEVKGGYRS